MMKVTAKSVIVALAMAFVATMGANAQDPTSYKEKFEQFKKSATKRFEDFRDQANNQYVDFLRTAWKRFNTLEPIEKPKDEDVPPIEIPEEEIPKEEPQPQTDPTPQQDKPVRRDGVPIDRVITPEPIKITPQPEPVSPIKPQPLAPQVRNIDFAIYNTPARVRFSDAQRISLGSRTNDDISNAWSRMSKSDYNNTVLDLLDLRKSLNLNDWAYAELVDAFTHQLYGDSDEATMTMAYVLCQSGYKTRLAKGPDGKLLVLIGTNAVIYNRNYLTLDGVNYYPFKGGKAQTLQVCNVEFPGEKAMSLSIPQQPKLSANLSNTRTIQSKRWPAVKVDVNVNKNLIDFYNGYPSIMVNKDFMTRWANYANTPIAPEVKNKLYPQLRELLSGLDQKAAVNRLLNWVQTGFVYEYDDKVWGGDRAFFAEETLYYPYCDCEDRSILFTRLVRDLLGLDCVLVYYPGHLASAVKFTESVDGDALLVNGDRYVICDATYINAPVGKTMPNMDNSKAVAIVLPAR